jgi:uncharacterized protein (DUF983 family)
MTAASKREVLYVKHRAPARPRSTDSPLEMPSMRRALAHVWSFVRLRCPHCGEGRVLRGRTVLKRCASCGLRFERSDENYFTAALVVNYFVCGVLFVTLFLGTLVVTWPDVPWNALTYGMPVVMVAAVVLLHPIAKVAWLTIDVMVRPVSADEFVLE